MARLRRRRWLQLRLSWLFGLVTLVAVITFLAVRYAHLANSTTSIAINASGSYTIDGQPIAPGKLGEALAGRHRLIKFWGGQPQAKLEIDPTVALVQVVQVVDRLQKADYERISFITKTSQASRR